MFVRYFRVTRKPESLQSIDHLERDGGTEIVFPGPLRPLSPETPLTSVNAFCTLTAMQSAQWYSWGPPNMQCRLCVSCWMYWKKYGGLKMPSRAEGPEERTSPSPASNVSVSEKKHTKTEHFGSFCFILFKRKIKKESCESFSCRLLTKPR